MARPPGKKIPAKVLTQALKGAAAANRAPAAPAPVEAPKKPQTAREKVIAGLKRFHPMD